MECQCKFFVSRFFALARVEGIERGAKAWWKRLSERGGLGFRTSGKGDEGLGTAVKGERGCQCDCGSAVSTGRLLSYRAFACFPVSSLLCNGHE